MTASVSPRFSGLQLFGVVVVALASFVLAVVPTLVYEAGPAPDAFEAIERHVRWGFGVGLGAILIARRWRRPWSVVVAWVILCLSGGYVLVRVVGIAMVDPGHLTQWGLVGAELAVCVLAWFWIRHKKDAPDRAEPLG